MTEQRNNVTEAKPPFSKPVTEFLQAIWAYFKFCIKPEITYGNRVLPKPDINMAYEKIEKIPRKPNESIYDIRNRNFAEVARTNRKLKFLKWEYKLAKKREKKELKARAFEAFKNLT